MDYYIYIYLDQRKPGKWEFKNLIFNFEPFYIGRGRGSRISKHLKPYLLNQKTLKSNKIRNIIENTSELPIHYKIFTNLSFEKSLELEKELIKKFGRIDNGTGILCNHTNGGEGVVGIKFNDKSKQIISKKCHNRHKSKNGFRGIYLTPENKWTSRNIINGKRIARRFDTKQEAAEAYDKIVIYLYGEDAQLNYPEKKEEYLKLDLLTNYLNHIKNHFYTNRKYGVTLIKSSKRWQSRILLNNKILHLGMYETEEKAAEVVDLAIILLKLNNNLNYPEKRKIYENIDAIDFFEKVLTNTKNNVNVYLQQVIKKLKIMGAQNYTDEDVVTTPKVETKTETTNPVTVETTDTTTKKEGN